ncbi:LAETG motif-containing sortase-dependent surface protein [Streptomyces sp. CBMA152]|uniref:LAETG motif-containing sortase-dependent surface protein n=1 Tax=Streptomyces sp. CBMA152 TaxID=1896312 RepID=UPI0016605688|nr:LAETG motif-containing sortase-dependent surface protein [Streptomyces sp. CBMA152]
MTVNRGTGRRRGALIGAAAAGLVGVGLTAVPAQAHTPVWQVTCTQVTVDLTRYSDQAVNTVTITADGKDLLSTEQFKGEFHKKLQLPDHKKQLTLRLVVKAGDGDQYSRDETKTAPVCDTPPPTKPSTKPSPPAKPTPTPSAKPGKPAPGPATSSAAAPAPQPSANLAETGSSSSTPLVAGMGGAVLLAGGGIVWAARRRRTGEH